MYMTKIEIDQILVEKRGTSYFVVILIPLVILYLVYNHNHD